MNAEKTEQPLPLAEVSSSELVRRVVYFTMIFHPLKGWIRVGRAYSQKDTAKSWLNFISKALGDRPSKVSTCTLTFVDGQLDEASRRTLDETYNMDAPNMGTRGRVQPSGHELHRPAAPVRNPRRRLASRIREAKLAPQ